MTTHTSTDTNTDTTSTAVQASAPVAAAPVAAVPTGYTTLTPFFCVDGAAEAIDFYCAVLGATVVSRFDGPGGTVAHAELQLAHGRMQLSDPAPGHHIVAREVRDDVSNSTVAYLPDVDAAEAERRVTDWLAEDGS